MITGRNADEHYKVLQSTKMPISGALAPIELSMLMTDLMRH